MPARTAVVTAAKPATTKATTKPATTKATTKPATTKATTKATPAKTSPIRKDVSPADVKPTSEQTAARIADIRAEALADMAASIENVNEYGMKIARRVLDLFRMSAPKLAGQSVTDYFAAMGIGEDENLYSMPSCAREWFAGEVWGKSKSVPVADVQAMTGASRATLARYRKTHGLVNENRTGGVETKAAQKAAAEPAPVKVPGQVVQSLTGIVNSIDDADMLADLIIMAADKLAELDSDALADVAVKLAALADDLA